MSDSLQPHGLYSPWNSPGHNTGVGNFSLLQGIFPTQRCNPGLLHCRLILYQMSHKGSKEGWVPMNWCFWIAVLEKTLQGLLNTKEIKPVNPKGNQPWIFIGRTDAQAEALILWPHDAKNRLIGEAPDGGKDWRWEEKGWQDKIVGWHHQLNGHESEQILGDSEGKGSLACCSPWGCKDSDIT